MNKTGIGECSLIQGNNRPPNIPPQNEADIPNQIAAGSPASPGAGSYHRVNCMALSIPENI